MKTYKLPVHMLWHIMLGLDHDYEPLGYGIGMLQVMLNDKCFSVDILVDWLNGIEGGLWSIQEANDILNGINGPIGAIE